MTELLQGQGTELDGTGDQLPDVVPTVLAVTGDPRAGSLTSLLAATVARRIGSELGLDPATAVAPAIDLGAVASRRLSWGEGPPADVTEQIRGAEILVVASPTIRGSYSGLLKLFLDALPGRALEGKLAVPVMSAATPRHALAAEVHLRPALTELGASCPTAALFALEARLSNSGAIVSSWLSSARPALSRVVLGPVAKRPSVAY